VETFLYFPISTESTNSQRVEVKKAMTKAQNDVEAVEGSAFLLSIAWPKGIKHES
jgi:hypothetical protein